MTNGESTRMLWTYAMSLCRIASLCVMLLAPLGAVQCEPADHTRPPMTPPNATGLAQGNAPPAAATPTDDNESMYASGEVAIGAEADAYDDDDPAALTDFHAALEPYGAWTDDSTYGTVWVPSPTVVGADFHPYVTAGHWVYDDDWVWASDYDWGWAPFHYGRWMWIEGRGWAWIPGRGYRGAWVMWGVDDGYSYIGWAPMAPAFLWFGGVAVGFPGYIGPRWAYCRRDDVFSPAVRTRVVVGAAAGPIAARVRPYMPATPNVAAAGPPPQKLGFQAAQIPHANEAASASIARAQQFSRPATAQALGARPPTRIPPVSVQAPRGAAVEQAPRGPVLAQPPRGPVFEQAPRGPVVGQAPAGTTMGRAPHAMGTAPVMPSTPSPGRIPAPSAVRPPAAPVHNAAPPVRVAPAPRMAPSPSFHGGGGHVR